MSPKTIEEYIADAPELAQKRLREMLKCFRTAIPGGEESIKWSMPAISRERILFTFGAHKNHVSVYATPSTFKPFLKELKGLKKSSSTIQFPLNQPIPTALLRKIAKHRLKDVVENGAKWM